MNNKIVSTKTTIAFFLVIVLVAGTIAISIPSFIIGVNAQAQPYYGMDNRYNSYESDYGMNNDKKSYGNDNSYDKSQYQPSSYKPDYKPAYSSYGKDDRDKSKDSSSINKINCINNNINNINSNNTGDVNIGNNGQVAPRTSGGDFGTSSFGGSGYGGEGYYNDGYDNKQDKDFVCIIDNNNNIVVGAGNQTTPGNQTDGNGNVIDTCEECFSTLNNTQISILLGRVNILSIEEYCDRLILTPNSGSETQKVLIELFQPTDTEREAGVIWECLMKLGLIQRSLTETLCTDGIDNDGDGLIDDADGNC